MLQKKIAWLLVGNETTGSSRIHGIKIHEFLLSYGIDSKIIRKGKGWQPNLSMTQEEMAKHCHSNREIFIFQKMYCKTSCKFAAMLKSYGKKVIFVMCDYDERVEMANIADLTIVTSKELLNDFSKKYRSKIIFIDDAVEFDIFKSKQHVKNKDLRVVWFGNSGGWDALQIVKPVISKIPEMRLVTISDHPNATIKWKLSNIESSIFQNDIGIVPVANSKIAKYKSFNRPASFMCLEIPVIASSIQSYADNITTGDNGFLASSKSEWKDCLEILLDPGIRANMSLSAKEKIVKTHTIGVIGRQWIDQLMLL